jgi:hypothetical protein
MFQTMTVSGAFHHIVGDLNSLLTTGFKNKLDILLIIPNSTQSNKVEAKQFHLMYPSLDAKHQWLQVFARLRPNQTTPIKSLSSSESNSTISSTMSRKSSLQINPLEMRSPRSRRNTQTTEGVNNGPSRRASIAESLFSRIIKSDPDRGENEDSFETSMKHTLANMLKIYNNKSGSVSASNSTLFHGGAASGSGQSSGSMLTLASPTKSIASYTIADGVEDEKDLSLKIADTAAHSEGNSHMCSSSVNSYQTNWLLAKGSFISLRDQTNRHSDQSLDECQPIGLAIAPGTRKNTRLMAAAMLPVSGLRVAADSVASDANLSSPLASTFFSLGKVSLSQRVNLNHSDTMLTKATAQPMPTKTFLDDKLKDSKAPKFQSESNIAGLFNKNHDVNGAESRSQVLESRLGRSTYEVTRSGPNLRDRGPTEIERRGVGRIEDDTPATVAVSFVNNDSHIISKEASFALSLEAMSPDYGHPDYSYEYRHATGTVLRDDIQRMSMFYETVGETSKEPQVSPIYENSPAKSSYDSPDMYSMPESPRNIEPAVMDNNHDPEPMRTSLRKRKGPKPLPKLPGPPPVPPYPCDKLPTPPAAPPKPLSLPSPNEQQTTTNTLGPRKELKGENPNSYISRALALRQGMIKSRSMTIFPIESSPFKVADPQTLPRSDSLQLHTKKVNHGFFKSSIQLFADPNCRDETKQQHSRAHSDNILSRKITSRPSPIITAWH